MKFTAKCPEKLTAALAGRGIGYQASFKLFRKRDVKVNGARVGADRMLETGDVVEAFWKIPIDRIFEDETLLIVDKGKGMEVTGEGSLEEILREENPKFRACHRLDRNTEGLVIFAKTEQAEHEVSRLIGEGKIRKGYECLLVSESKPRDGRYEANLFKNAKLGKVFIFKEPAKGTKKILTNLRVIDKIYEEVWRAEVLIETGRTHQIRAHLAFLGYPVLGDEKYGDFAANKRFRTSSQCLRASRIEFSGCDGLFSEWNGRKFESKRTWKF